MGPFPPVPRPATSPPSNHPTVWIEILTYARWHRLRALVRGRQAPAKSGVRVLVWSLEPNKLTHVTMRSRSRQTRYPVWDRGRVTTTAPGPVYDVLLS